MKILLNFLEELNPLSNSDIAADFRERLAEFNAGFKRPERLDVKKPGPPFDGPITTDSSKNIGKCHPRFNNERIIICIIQLDHNTQITNEDAIIPSMMKKEPRGPNPNHVHEVYDVDTDYVYVIFKERYIQQYRI